MTLVTRTKSSTLDAQDTTIYSTKAFCTQTIIYTKEERADAYVFVSSTVASHDGAHR